MRAITVSRDMSGAGSPPAQTAAAGRALASVTGSRALLRGGELGGDGLQPGPGLLLALQIFRRLLDLRLQLLDLRRDGALARRTLLALGQTGLDLAHLALELACPGAPHEVAGSHTHHEGDDRHEWHRRLHLDSLSPHFVIR